MQHLLFLKNVSFVYDNRPVIEKISFTLPSGDFLGILGPNGSGKTTLLRLMSGVSKPAKGEIELLNRSMGSYRSRERARIISVVPQSFDILFPFTALEVVLMGRWPYLKSFSWESAEDLHKAREAMEATDCLQFADRPITELSGGERERVILARALAQDPKILLLDEPTTHLDLKHQQEIHSLLLKLNREKGLTVVVVLHDLNFASMVCRRLLLLREGKLFKLGDPQEVMSPETIRQVFGVHVGVEKHPQTGKPFYLPWVDQS
jgi:iron complex transport system ATP-binding protein